MGSSLYNTVLLSPEYIHHHLPRRLSKNEDSFAECLFHSSQIVKKGPVSNLLNPQGSLLKVLHDLLRANVISIRRYVFASEHLPS